MKFPMFEFQITHNVGLDALSTEAITALRDANDQINKLAHYTPDTDLKTYKKNLITDLKDLNATSFHRMSFAFRQEYQQQRLSAWHKKQEEFLQNPDTWETFLQKTTIPKTVIQNLKTEFSQQLPLAHWQSKNIVELIVTVFPVFENYLCCAQVELKLKRKKLPTELSQEFSTYLALLQHKITQQKVQIIETMLTRLAIASDKKNLVEDDVILTMIEKLAELNLLNLQYLNVSRHGLTSQVFEFFHRYILQKGNEEQIDRLKKMFWFQDDSIFSVCSFKQNMFIVPTVILESNLIPKKPRIPKFLFRGHNFRHEFFIQNFYLMCQLKTISHIKVKNFQLAHILENDTWLILAKLTEGIKTQIQLYENKRSTWLESLFRKQTQRFLKHWIIFLQRKAQEVLQLKVCYANHVAQQIQTRVQFEIDFDILASQNFRQELSFLINDLENSFANEGDSELKKQWHTIKHQFHDLLIKNDIPHLQNQLRSILDSLINHDRFMLDHIEISTRLTNLIKIFDKLQTFSNQVEYTKKLIHKIFIYYLNTCVEGYIKNHLPDSIRLIEDLIMNHAPEYLKKRCLLISQIRQKNDFLFHTKCKAMLYSLDGKGYTPETNGSTLSVLVH